jgi:hypothetical protein
MEMAQLLFYSIIGVSLILLLITGITLMARGKASHQINLTILGFIDILVFFSYILIAFTEFWLYINIQMVIIHVLSLIFIKQTFYHKTQSAFRAILIFILICGAVLIIIQIGVLTGDIIKNEVVWTIDVFCTNAIIMPVFFWYAISANNARKKLIGKNVEPWILGRLQIISISAFIGAFLQVSDFLRLNSMISLGDFANPLGFTVFYIQSTIAVICSICQYFAWIMPPKMKAFFNRNFQKDTDLEQLNHLSDEEILRQFRGDTS